MSLEDLDTEQIEIGEEMTDEPLRRFFVLPRKIKVVKTVLAFLINFLLGGASIGLAIYFFINPWEDSTYIKVLAAFLLIFGASIFLQFPFTLARTFLAHLDLGEKVITSRNSFRINKMKWDDVQDILIREKLTRDMSSTEIIGLDLVRFRSVTNAIYFLGDNYPKDEVMEIISSIKKAFSLAVEGTDHQIIAQTERPSIQIRMIYFTKETKEQL
ncbi:MAG: hypothetical protein FK730_00835 [Asgard group archaeon]|nr:hypothetical protein [Asgard group archaeon]